MTTNLKNGILIEDEEDYSRMILIVQGMGFEVVPLENDYVYMSDEWIKRENEINEIIKSYS
jgi:hypothetical protein